MAVQQLVFVLAFVSVGAADFGISADEPAKTEVESSAPKAETDDDAERRRRGEFLKMDVDRYTVVAVDRPERPFTTTDKTLLRWSNPVRNFFSDGAVFLWLDAKRPMAVAMPSIRGKGNVAREFTSLSTSPLECRRNRQVIWAPRQANFAGQSLAESEPPDDSEKRRLRQIRDISRRFRATKGGDSGVELRLMTQPIYRYACEEQGIIDGALFSFVEATDSDLLLLVEACRGDTQRAEWRYTLARMTSTAVAVELDGERVWAGEGYYTNPQSIRDPYIEIHSGKYPP